MTALVAHLDWGKLRLAPQATRHPLNLLRGCVFSRSGQSTLTTAFSVCSPLNWQDVMSDGRLRCHLSRGSRWQPVLPAQGRGAEGLPPQARPERPSAECSSLEPLEGDHGPRRSAGGRSGPAQQDAERAVTHQPPWCGPAACLGGPWRSLGYLPKQPATSTPVTWPRALMACFCSQGALL